MVSWHVSAYKNTSVKNTDIDSMDWSYLQEKKTKQNQTEH